MACKSNGVRGSLFDAGRHPAAERWQMHAHAATALAAFQLQIEVPML